MKSLRNLVAVLVALVFFTLMAKADSTNSLSDSEIEERALVQKILAQRPSNNFTNTGTLYIQGGDGPRKKLPVTCETIAGETHWQSRYEARLSTNSTDVTTLLVTHEGTDTNHYESDENGGKASAEIGSTQIAVPFAGSDFWLCDLGLEFFHWPQQKVLKKEFHRQCACMVLESTNPNPAPGGYSRVVCWIDEDSLGIVEAYAYDAKGNKLKNFYPKNFEKVNGQYQLQSMVMENVQTGSKSVMEFDLDK
ncbi:MAG TPA: outer membrane lipoprotein-sorting protein [Verrucomicrobiae bacterium]|nr:outer membrane lipoprotein-sorting protein [Verrucomicrobiae bacterium]